MYNEKESILRALANGRILRFDGAGARIGPVPYTLTTAQELKSSGLMAYKASAGGFVSSKRGRAEAAKLPVIVERVQVAQPDPRFGRVSV